MATTWNYRVVKRSEAGEVTFAIHEAYYRDGQCWTITSNPVGALGESVEGLRQALAQMMRALDEPVLNYEDFPDPEQAKQVLESLEGKPIPWEKAKSELKEQ